MLSRRHGINWRPLRFTIHVCYTGRRGWGHNYRVAHNVDLQDIMRFELYKDHESTRRILQTCGMHLPWFRSVDVDEVRIDWVATALDWDSLFLAAKRLEEERIERLNSQLMLLPYTDFMSTVPITF